MAALDINSAAALRLTIQNASRHRTPCRNTLRRWILAALERRAHVTLRFVDGAEGRRLNHCYRARDYATNVLTFVYQDLRPLQADIIVCLPVARREARERGLTLRAHCAHLIVHGTLHMQGYDHERLPQARKMEALETRIMHTLGYSDPYSQSSLLE